MELTKRINYYIINVVVIINPAIGGTPSADNLTLPCINQINKIVMTKMNLTLMKRFVLIFCFCLFLFPDFATAQISPPEVENTDIPEDTTPEIPQKVDVEPLAEDIDISSRLVSILRATQW
ncbi:hypothetical protein, partial [uncultured Rubinisphaera sp.]|uniref:hypothetical protein n=1 Tax=uncultured Rubinisphaera sp. TaxID=1678686 RepID=UPI0030DD2907